MAKILADILTKEKFEVITAINGQIGVEKAIEFNPDLIITDNMMPVKTGLEVIVELRARKEFQTTPIFMITAKAGHQDPALAKEAGATRSGRRPCPRPPTWPPPPATPRRPPRAWPGRC